MHETAQRTRSRGTGPVANQRGQALAETAIIVTLLLMLVMGIVEFGRAFMVSNMIVHAARDGARFAAVAPVSSRDDAGMITNTTSIKNHVRSAIASVVGASTAQALTVNVTQGAGPPPIVTVQVTGSVPFIINWAGMVSFPVNRSVTFRDEGRA